MDVNVSFGSEAIPNDENRVGKEELFETKLELSYVVSEKNMMNAMLILGDKVAELVEALEPIE